MSWTDTLLRRRWWIAMVVWALAAPLLSAGEGDPPNLDVPYVPTDSKAVEEMLKLVGVTGKDYVIDLGCGDGRIVVMAAKVYKARGLGVDLDPKRVGESKQNAAKAGVTDLVEFRKEDVMKTDVRRASVVTLFLLEEVNVRLRPKLFAELKPGSRVVSNTFHMRDWKPDKEVRHERAYGKVLLFWVIPAPVAGAWTWQTKIADKELPGAMKLDQEFQAVQGSMTFSGGPDVPITEASLAGKELRFTATVRTGNDQAVVAYRGTADGDTLKGTQEWRGGPNAGTYPWVAVRKPVDLAGQWQVRAPSHAEDNGTLHIRRGSDGLKAAYVRDSDAKTELPLLGFYVWGSSVRFEIPQDGSPLAFRGSLGPESGGGSVAKEQSKEHTAWSAKRLAPK